MPEVIDKVAKIDSRNDIYSFLRNQILSLSIEPGEMLSENSLSSQMNVSRALVRDALARLTEEGYIVVYPQRGTVVTMIDPERIKQSVHTHIVLEQAVIEEVCRQGLTPEQKALLEESLEKQKEVKGTVMCWSCWQRTCTCGISYPPSAARNISGITSGHWTAT